MPPDLDCVRSRALKFIIAVVYRELTAKLTNLEQPRTQREYEDSFTFKMFLFEFINMYSSLIYIAFFKGRKHGPLIQKVRPPDLVVLVPGWRVMMSSSGAFEKIQRVEGTMHVKSVAAHSPSVGVM
ncbi:anoctamin [Trichonephila clavipes]|nr:anoctamin [Trichonephila clavipes]